MKLVEKWPESARIIKHAENSKNGMLHIRNHIDATVDSAICHCGTLPFRSYDENND